MPHPSAYTSFESSPGVLSAFDARPLQSLNVNVNLAMIDSTQPVVSQYSSSAGVSPYAFLVNGLSYISLANANVQSNYKSLGFRLLRIHVGNENTIMNTTFPTTPGTSGQVWTEFDTLFAAVPNLCTLANTRLYLTGGVAPAWCDVTTATGRSQYAALMVQIATRAVGAGLEITYWAPYNEPNPKMTSAQYAALHLSVATALKSYAAGRGKTYLVGGPTIDQPPISTWIADMVTTAGKDNVDFLVWHNYGSGVNSTSGMTWAQYAAAALNQAGTAHTGLTQAQGADASISSNIPMAITEWNMNFNPTPNDEVWQVDHRGAVYAALFTHVMLTQQSGANMEMMSLFEAAGDSSFGVIRSTNASGAIDPQGYVLSRIANFLPGSQVTYTVAGSMNVTVLPTVSGSTFGMMLINYDETTTYTVSVVLHGYPSSTVTYWEVSAAHLAGVIQTKAIPELLSLSIPALSVILLSS